MSQLDTRENHISETPTTKVHEHRSVFHFDEGDGEFFNTPVIAKWTIEYQPNEVVATEEGVKDVLPGIGSCSPEEAAQTVYGRMAYALFERMENPPLVVRLDYDTGSNVYKDPGDFPHSITVGRFR